mmetsp:Transcript_20460/g.37148  ORF Transcript_20460/g.37148 Transcript_20460/m.37148 type:complete len:92 (-) Transcript_20460:601-876(-)
MFREMRSKSESFRAWMAVSEDNSSASSLDAVSFVVLQTLSSLSDEEDRLLSSENLPWRRMDFRLVSGYIPPHVSSPSRVYRNKGDGSGGKS